MARSNLASFSSCLRETVLIFKRANAFRTESLGAGLSLFCADDIAQGSIIPDLCAQFGAWFDWIVVRVGTSPTGFDVDLDGEFDLEDDPTFNVATSCPTFQWVGNGGTNTVYRFREGIERYMITDINNPVLVSVDRANSS